MNAVDTARRDARARDAAASAAPSLTPASPEEAVEAVTALADPLADYPIAGVQVPPPDRVTFAAPDTSEVAAPNVVAPDAPPATAPPVPTLEHLARLGMWLPDPLALVLGLGESTGVCPGVQVGGMALGCTPAEKGYEPGVSSTGGVVPGEGITAPLTAGAPAPPG